MPRKTGKDRSTIRSNKPTYLKSRKSIGRSMETTSLSSKREVITQQCPLRAESLKAIRKSIMTCQWMSIF